MTKVYFVRHAQPDFSHVEDSTRPLTAEGQNDARIVLETLKDEAIDVAYCSPYLRSMDTIRETAAHFGLPIRTDRRLRERESGAGGNGPCMFQKRWADHDFHEEGGESIGMVQRRNIEALTDILAENEGKRILIGTHGTALSCILNHYDPSFGCEDFLRIIDWMPYIIELDFDGKTLTGARELAHVAKVYKGR